MNDNESNFLEDERQVENEEDLDSLGQTSFSSAVVSGNDWTTETIISQINKGNILLNPDFQRRDAWDKKRKSKFIESLILGLPIPQVVLAESKERRGSYIVLDGKQRLLSIRQFAADSNDENYDTLKLTALDIRSDLEGKSLSSMKGDLTCYDDLTAFENQPIRTIVIKNWPNEDFLYHVFLRLNTGSVPLSPQELRQALHPGGFVRYIDAASAQSNALKEILKLKKPDFRMRDTELLLRFFAFNNYLSDYAGNLKKFLDDVCKRLNKDWDAKSNQIDLQLLAFEEAHKALEDVFGHNRYRKWNGTAYESRFNRAIFDILMLSFSREMVLNAYKGNELLIENAFKQLCEEDRDFLASIESTTKSLGATCNRIAIWNATLNDILGISLHVPRIIDNRII